MPQLLGEDDYTETWQTDDGRVTTVAKDVAQRMVPQDWRAQQPPESMSQPAQGMDSEVLQESAQPIVQPPPQHEPLQPANPQVAPLHQAILPGPENLPALSAPEPGPPPPPRPGSGRPTPLSIDPDASGAQLQQQGVVEGAQAQIGANDVLAENMAKRNDEIAALEAERHAERASSEQQLAAKREEISAEIKRVNDMKVHRRGVFDSPSGGGTSAMAVIGAALAGLGMALKGRGGENPALAMLMKRVDNDVLDQRAAIDRARQGIGAMKDEYGMDISAAGRIEDNAHAHRAAVLDQYARMGEQIAVSTKNPAVAANAKAMVGRLRSEQEGAEAAAALQAREEERADRRLAEQERQGRSSRALGRANFELKARSMAANEAEAERAKAAAVEAAAAQGTLIDPLTGEGIGVNRFGGDLKAARSDQEALNTRVDLVKDLSEYTAAIKQAGSLMAGGDVNQFIQTGEGQRLMQQYELLLSRIAMANNKGALTEQDIDRMRKVILKPEGLLQRASPVSGMEQLISTQTRKTGDWINSRTGDPQAARAYQNKLSSYYEGISKDKAINTEEGAAFKEAIRTVEPPGDDILSKSLSLHPSGRELVSDMARPEWEEAVNDLAFYATRSPDEAQRRSARLKLEALSGRSDSLGKYAMEAIRKNRKKNRGR